jgi:hypothetical protein
VYHCFKKFTGALNKVDQKKQDLPVGSAEMLNHRGDSLPARATI